MPKSYLLTAWSEVVSSGWDLSVCADRLHLLQEILVYYRRPLMPSLTKPHLIALIVLICCPLLGVSQSKIELILAKADSTTDLSKKALLLTDVSQRYWGKDPAQSIKYGEEALIYARKSKSPEQIGFALNAIGHAYSLKSDYVLATTYLLEALQTFEAAEMKTRSMSVINNLGIVHLNQDNYLEARKYFRRYYQHALSKRDNKGLATATTNLGVVYYHIEDYDSALFFQNQYLEVSESEGDDQGVAIAKSNIGDVLYKQKKYDKALDAYRESQTISENIGDGEGVIITLIGEGKSLVKLGQASQAVPLLTEALGYAQSNGFASYVQDSRRQLSIAEKELGHYDRAYEHYEKYVWLKDSLFNSKNTGQLNALQESYEITKRESAIALLEKSEDYSQLVQKVLIFGMLILAVFVLVLAISAISLFRGNSAKKKANLALTQSRQEIAVHNAELRQQQEEILSQRDALDEQNHKLEDAFTKIEKQHKNITDSINYAKRIQEATLSNTEELKNAFSDYFVLFKPRDVVSGDFYWFAKKQEIYYLAVVDCTGHGVPGAFMSMIANDLLNQAVHLKKITDPAAILDYLHTEVINSLKQFDGVNRDGMDVAICTTDPQKGTLNYAGAKRPLVIIKDGAIELIRGDRQPVGGGFSRKNRTPFTKHTFQLDKESSYYIYSDGYQDQFGGEDTRKLTTTAFRQLLAKQAHLPMAEQLKALEDFLNEWKGSTRQFDDILVIGFRG